MLRIIVTLLIFMTLFFNFSLIIFGLFLIFIPIIIYQALEKFTSHKLLQIISTILIYAIFIINVYLGIPHRYLLFEATYFSLIPAFILTIIIEGLFLIRYMEKKLALRSVLTANVISYLLIIGCLWIFHFHFEDNPFKRNNKDLLISEDNFKMFLKNINNSVL